MVTITFRVPEDTLPSLYSAVEEISNELGTRLEGPHRHDHEAALTRASRAMGSLRAAVSEAHAKLAKEFPRERRWFSPLGDKDYRR